ncbi:MAG: TetR/AcrR family transcriptional regulator [Anaerolineae bacterium]|jgi:AcrR family transcriptional regulator|nr:TetR/AcrR family transcriptional regulator [Anaerolineae bacterium]MBT3712626.1 TetR/AcrR family transcriptional regulator [Anaerolineae bacterium]MBT4311764.1 TetR/AcrR family transcriptional regulator [Anaerolineae bacterium]MBT4457320.1 TetR/AcrR family transcriptional regulator [Anaerolineae bacterium]MBT4842863.1 TetR/AcrR family transcriptional regulator [Anaerolineae bacterium]
MSNIAPTKKKKARQRILEAAAESFQTLGYARTTTQAIADKAGVAEVTLFRHFGDKQTLFKKIIQQIGGGVNFELLEEKLSGDLEADLTTISQHALHFFITQQDAIRMLMFESVHFPEMKVALAQNPNGMIELLVRYFAKQHDASKVQVSDPQLTAQAFMSMVFGYAIGMNPISDLLPAEIPVENMSAEFVHIFLATLKPNNQ